LRWELAVSFVLLTRLFLHSPSFVAGLCLVQVAEGFFGAIWQHVKVVPAGGCVLEVAACRHAPFGIGCACTFRIMAPNHRFSAMLLRTICVGFVCYLGVPIPWQECGDALYKFFRFRFLGITIT